MPKKKENKGNLIVGNSNYNKVLIFSHGLGDDPTSWLFFANEILKEIDNIRIILTRAPINKVSVNNGLEMPSWFDIKKIPIDVDDINQDCDVEYSCKFIYDIIDNEINNGIESNNIFLGGFSQGAALSLVSGLNYENYNLGGLIILSGWLLKEKITNLKKLKKDNNIRVFVGHGIKDNVVKYSNLEDINNFLKNKYNSKLLTINSYPNMDHSVSMKERIDVINWLKIEK